MNILRLKARGFTGLAKGIGVDEIDVDLSDLSGLIAISGANGSGKSSFIELLSPFRCLASRSKALQHHVFMRNSLKDLSFIFDGDQYRTLVKIDSESERQEAFIYKNGNSASETDGKVSEYDRFITGLFGSQNLFFNSIFCAQGSDKLSDLRPGELKALFSEFLRLYLLEQYETTSKQCGIILTGQGESLNKETERLTLRIATLGNVKQAIEEKLVQLSTERHRQTNHRDNLKTSEQNLEQAQENLAQKKVAEQRVKGLREQLEQVNKDITTDRSQADTELTEMRVKVGQIILDIKTVGKILEDRDKIESAETQAKGIEADIDEALTLIESQSEQIAEITADIHHAELARSQAQKIGTAKIESAKKVVDQIDIQQRDQRRAFMDTKKTLEELRDDKHLHILKLRVYTCKEQMEDLKKRDPQCTSTTCSFIVKALGATEEWPGLESKLAYRQEEVTELEKEAQEQMIRIESKLSELIRDERVAERALDALQAAEMVLDREWLPKLSVLHKDRQNADVALSKLKGMVEGLKAERVAISNLAAKKPDLEVAMAKIETLEKRKSELIDEGLGVKTTWQAREDKKRIQLIEISNRIWTIEKDISTLSDEALSDLITKIKTIKSIICTSEEAIAAYRASLAVLEKDLAEKVRLESELKEAQTKKSHLITEASEWAYLKNACSANGLRALEIDAVAPIITSYANDLLVGTFGPNMSVRFRTQNDDGREVLDILVIREDGSEVLLENMSGGEKVWILKSLRLAMTLISKEKSGKDYKCIICDEEDGALSKDNAVQFVGLYRTLLKMAGMETCFYISHKQEALALADHQIEFKNGGIAVD